MRSITASDRWFPMAVNETISARPRRYADRVAWSVNCQPALLGAMLLGGATFASEAHRMLGRFLDAGGTFIDTADAYGDGESERTLAPSDSHRKFPKCCGAEASGEHTRPRVWCSGVSPNRVFRRDAGNCTRGRVRSPDLPETVAPLRFPEMISERCFSPPPA
jgi:Aldo/keto reductase family